jgi:hypothetical protein
MSRRTHRILGTIAGAAAVAAVLVAPGGGARAALHTLYVNYTMQCTFTITDDSGKIVTSIAPGTWQVAVSTPGSFGGVDLSGLNDMTACQGSVDFKLSGPGVNLATTLNDGDGSYDMLSGNFAPSSTYVAVDGNQPSVARAQFSTLASGMATGSAGGSSSSSGGSGSSGSSTGSASSGTGAQAAAIGTLKGTVGSTGVLKLSYRGKGVATLKPGKYTVTVVDTSTNNGFILHGKSSTTVSSAPFVGRKSVVVNLKTGQWYFAPSSKGKKVYFVVTAPAVAA